MATELVQIGELSREEFLSLATKRITSAKGKCLDPGLKRRMEHPICLDCQERYRKKFPGRPFGIRCKGIFSEDEIVEISEISGTSYEKVRENLDIPYWASRHIRFPNQDGDLVPFEARDYQCESLWCTARFQVDRWGRGLGKTSDGVIKELHKATTNKRYDIMVACPAKAQAQKWFDEISNIISNDELLRASLVQVRQAPYYTFKFSIGSTINIFTTGSSSGRDADVIRSQSPRRVRIDEQDLLNPGDYNAIMPLLRRYTDSEFHGSSTPTGKRETFYAMCKEYPDYRELHFPISRHPDWTEEMEKASRREARTELNYMHEFEAEFGELEGGVFKAAYIDAAKKNYEYPGLAYDQSWRYFLGVDWNGKGTGTRLRVVGYNPKTGTRKAVDLAAVNTSTMDTLDQIRILNRKWHCEGTFIDAGFGFVQDELLRLIGHNSQNADDRRLMNVHVIDFGANLKTNKLVPNRSKYIDDDELERPTKPFMVEGAQMVVEMGDFEFSNDDKLLEEQLRAYKVKTYSRHGWANTYDSRVGDHDLDAVMLALLGIEMTYGLTRNPDRKPANTTISYAAGFGSGEGQIRANPADWDRPPQTPREAAQRKGDVPVRAPAQNTRTDNSKTTPGPADAMGVVRQYFVARPSTPASSGRGIPSRTAMFRNGAARNPYSSNSRMRPRPF